MIKPLRKRHLQIWIALAFLLPAGIVLSWLVIPNPVPVKLLNPVTTELLPVIKYKKDNAQYCITIRTNKENSEWQLEWNNRFSLAVPSAVIYRTSPSPSKGGVSRSFTPGGSHLVGRIEARGNYMFQLPSDSTAKGQFDFILYDFIHQKVIDSLNFKTPL
jgi:hypothetical protein